VSVVYDFGTDDGELFLVMEYLAGHTAADLIAEVGPVPVGWAAAIGAQVCAVLAAAHAMSLIHRDLKPSNILIGPDGAVKVLDFGLAAAVGLDEFSQITYSGQIPGTASYLAPEVAAGLPAEPRSDLYAVGRLLHELLTGSGVSAASGPGPVIARPRSQDPQPVLAARPDVPAEFGALILELLAGEPANRPRDAASAFARLLPFARSFPPLPGVVDPAALGGPGNMYAAVQERVSRG